MGTAQLQCKIPGSQKPYDLIVSTYQMCILCLFNFKAEMALSEIAESMGFDEETCKKNLQSLQVKQCQILICKDGKFSVNKNFKHNQRRINFPVPVLEESVKKEKITTDRSHAVDAAIVRIMKSRKKMNMVELRLEVITIM